MRIVGGNVPPVVMSGHSRHDLSFQLVLGYGRIMEQTELIVLSGMEFQEEGFLGVGQMQRHADCVDDGADGCVELPVKREHEFSEAGEDGFWKPDVGVGWVFLAADLVAFLGILVSGGYA